MDARIVNTFLAAVIVVLKKMEFDRPEAGKPYLKESAIAQGDITGIINLTGDNKKGSFSVTFEKDCILKVVSKMFGEELESITDDVSDTVGELTGRIFGSARDELEKNGVMFDSCKPAICKGEKHEIKHFADGPRIAVPFSIDVGNLTAEICLE